MMESRAAEVVLHDVRHPIFMKLLEYLYTDQVDVPLDMTMELFQAADQVHRMSLFSFIDR